MYRISYFSSFDALPAPYAPLLQEADRLGFFHQPAWFDFLLKNFYEDDNALHLYAVEEMDGGRPLLLMPLRYTTTDGAVRGARTLAALGHMENYSTLSLLVAPEARAQLPAILSALFLHLRTPQAEQHPACIDALRLWPVAVESELEQVVFSALRHAGFWVQAYANSFNRYEDTAGLSFEDYFARRSSNMRYNVRRRQRNLEKQGKLEFDLYFDPESYQRLQQGIMDYITVAKASWKSPISMMPVSMLDFIRLAALKGCLRLGTLRLDGRPIATQFWLVSGGVASCVRLAYDEEFKKQAPGVVLTNFMIQHILDRDHAAVIDFGYGEEAYKESWMKDARYYEGFMAFNPATRRGVYFGLKHILGQAAKRTVKWPFRPLIHLLRRLRRRAGSEAEE